MSYSYNGGEETQIYSDDTPPKTISGTFDAEFLGNGDLVLHVRYRLRGHAKTLTGRITVSYYSSVEQVLLNNLPEGQMAAVFQSNADEMFVLNAHLTGAYGGFRLPSAREVPNGGTAMLTMDGPGGAGDTIIRVEYAQAKFVNHVDGTTAYASTTATLVPIIA